MINYLCKRLESLIVKGYKKFYIYPFGTIGMQVKDILEKKYAVEECIGVDNYLCTFNKNIISCDKLEKKIWAESEVAVIASNDGLIYNDIRLKIRIYVPSANIRDLFPVHPFMDHNDKRVASLAAVAREVYRKNIPGAVAEAGVYQGEFAKYINIIFPDRKLYLFDSFEGFDSHSISNVYDNSIQVEEWIGTLKDTSIALVMNKMKFPENIVIKKGYIPDTTRNITDKFCFVNLDMDLYLPTYEGLNFFWENLSEGGLFLYMIFICGMV